MDDLEWAQQQADEVSEHLGSIGFTKHCSALLHGVYRRRLDRHDPEIAGDNAKTLGFGASENFGELAVRPLDEGGLRVSDDRWVLTRNRGSVLLRAAGASIRFMKLPTVGDDRVANWDGLDWKHDSGVRQDMAVGNSVLLGLVTGHPDQGVLGAEIVAMSLREEARRPNFIIGWTGHPTQPLTSGYLFLPAAGEQPALCPVRLWHDEPGQRPRGSRPVEPVSSTRFDELPEPDAAVKLRPRPAREKHAQ